MRNCPTCEADRITTDQAYDAVNEVLEVCFSCHKLAWYLVDMAETHNYPGELVTNGEGVTLPFREHECAGDCDGDCQDGNYYVRLNHNGHATSERAS